MKQEQIKSLTTTAILLAICICSQFFKNLSVYITGPIVNTCIIICVLSAGLGFAIMLSVITPVTAFLITGSPVMSAIPLIIPGVMAGNIVLAVSIYLIGKSGCKKSKDSGIVSADQENLKNKKSVGRNPEKLILPISMFAGSVLKAVFMGVVISLIIIPSFLPPAMEAKKVVFQTTFSITQLITGLIGSLYALIIWPRISRKNS